MIQQINIKQSVRKSNIFLIESWKRVSGKQPNGVSKDLFDMIFDTLFLKRILNK